MYTVNNTNPIYRNAPVGLTSEQAADPFIVLDWFFYPADHLPKYQNWLRQWLTIAISGKNKWTRNKLTKCFYRFNSMAHLLEALWVIHERGDTFTEQQMAVRNKFKGDYIWSERVHDHMRWYGYQDADFLPKFIDIDEEEMPFQVIHDFFKEQDVFEAKQKLSDWCMATVANHWEYEVMARQKLVTVYEEMNRILEAVFIIVEVRLLELNC